MPLISIREHGAQHPGAVVSIDGQEYAITITDPFGPKEEEQLEWYFEQHLAFPFTGQVKAQTAAASITTYGEALFNQIFADRRAYARYQAALQQGIETLSFEIAGSPDFHRLHWEALKDPDLPQPLALQATFVRRNLAPRSIEATLRPSPTINLLIVTARPGGASDVGYRTISRPLVHALRQANLRVNIEILRPGSYEALVQHLEARQDQHGAGYYHVIHFDVHGSLLTYAQFDQLEKALPAITPHTFQARRYGRPHIPKYEGVKAFLFLESAERGKADPLEATELAQLLIHHGIPIAILNACQSGKQIGASETSLASQLMQGGLQMVLAMGYSVTVSAAELVMQQLYRGLFAGHDLSAAIRRARLELFNRKQRRAYFNQTIDLEDWLLPVVYQNQPQRLQPREFMPAESAAFYQRQANRYPDAKVTYEFVGRDLDILHIERALLLQRNMLLVQGMGGAGKTTLLHHLAHWWQTTGFVAQVFYFGYDQHAWTRQQIMDAIARQLLGESHYVTQFQPLPGDEVKQAFLTERLRAARHLIILDNLESITGSALAIPNTLPADEQTKLHHLLSALAGGKTFVLLGSRGGETWLAPQTFVDNIYDLPGLDPEAAAALADLILHRHAATQYRSHPDFQKLLKLLDGYPLPLEVVLANLAHQSPSAVLQALQAGDIALDTPDAQDKIASIIGCISYSHSNLAPNAQQLLLCLAPFTSVINTKWLPQYFDQLQTQPTLIGLPLTAWPAVVQAARDWGLLAPHSALDGYLRIQPILPYFLKHRLQQSDPAISAAIDTAFHHHYADIAPALGQAIKSKDAAEQQIGKALIGLEYENLAAALHLTLTAQATFYYLYEALFRYLLARQAHQEALALSQMVWQAHQNYDAQQMTGEVGEQFSLVLHRLATQQLTLRQYEAARQTYAQAIELVRHFVHFPPAAKGRSEAGTYHQLGVVAMQQRQWAQAEQHYQQALALFIEFNDRYRQASTYHNLGIVAAEQRQWAQAEQHYQQALTLFIEFSDRYRQASTYHHLGSVALAQGQWDQAEQHYQHALALQIEVNDRYSQASAYGKLGIVAAEQRQWDQAEQYYQQALALSIEFNDRYSQAKAYHHLGSVAMQQRQWTQARDYLLQDLTISVEFNDQPGVDITLRMLARLWQSSGLTNLPAAAAAILNAAPEAVEATFRNRLTNGSAPPI